jgi:hypothetical protein
MLSKYHPGHLDEIMLVLDGQFLSDGQINNRKIATADGAATTMRHRDWVAKNFERVFQLPCLRISFSVSWIRRAG